MELEFHGRLVLVLGGGLLGVLIELLRGVHHMLSIVLYDGQNGVAFLRSRRGWGRRRRGQETVSFFFSKDNSKCSMLEKDRKVVPTRYHLNICKVIIIGKKE